MKFECPKKKVALFIPDLSMGGTFTLLKSLIRDLSKVFDLCLIVQEDKKLKNLDIVTHCLGTRNTLLSIISLRSLCKSHRFTAIFSFMERANLIAYLASCLLPTHSVFSIHNSPKQAFRQRTKLKCIASKLLYRCIHKQTPIVAVSNGISNELLRDYGLTNVTTIYNSVDKKVASKQTSNELITIITHCRLVKQKRLDILIDCVYKVREQCNNYRFIIVGDGPLKDELNSKILELNCQDYIQIKSNRDPHELLECSDVFVQSSLFEGFGISMIEAMSWGLAIVAVDCDYGPREILKSDYGILLNNGKRDQIVNGMCDALIGLLSNPEKLNKYKEIALVRSKSFTSEEMKNSYVTLFNSLN